MTKKVFNAVYEIGKMFIICAFTVLLGDEIIEDGFEDLVLEGSHTLNVIFVVAWVALTVGAISKAIYAGRACAKKDGE